MLCIAHKPVVITIMVWADKASSGRNHGGKTMEAYLEREKVPPEFYAVRGIPSF